LTLFDQRPIRPMLADTREPFDSKDYVFEVKWDGMRALVFKNGPRIELQNRNLRDVTAGFPELQELRNGIRAAKAIIDGEAVVLGDNGTPEFGRLQNRFGVDDPKRAEVLSKTIPVTYVAFDLLHLNGKDIASKPLLERKEKLKEILKEGPHLLFGDHIEEYGKRYFGEASKKGFEGIIGKERNSPYLPGTRGIYWIKSKGVQTMDCIIVGYTPGEGARTPTFGSLVVAAHGKNGELVHLTNVGGGFDNQTLDSLKRRLVKMERKTPVLSGTIDAPGPITWVRPELVCEVKYMSFTHEQKLRFPRFSRMRTDKTPEECTVDSF
jgi:bifunctional non-homologous end joining protein LigD